MYLSKLLLFNFCLLCCEISCKAPPDLQYGKGMTDVKAMNNKGNMKNKTDTAIMSVSTEDGKWV